MKKPTSKAKKKPPKGTYVVLSFTVPPELEHPMNAAAALRGMSRSAYLVWLVRRDLRDVPGLPEPPSRPARIKRNQ